MKNADHVLPGRGVDPGFTPNRGVDHSHQSRRNLDDRNAAHKRRGDEPGEVPNHSTTQRNYGRVTATVFGDHLVGETSPGFASFVGLAGRNRKNFDDLWLKLIRQDSGVESPDVGVGDDRIPVGWDQLAYLGPELRQET